jgi:hypothetical protein
MEGGLRILSDTEEATTYAYTPGLKVQGYTRLVKKRILPVLGDVLVKEGDEVSYDTVVATTKIPGIPYISRTGSVLGVDPDEVQDFLIKNIGDTIEKGETLAKYRGFFGLFTRTCESPASGTIESLSSITGCVIIREPDTVVNLDAYIPGRISEVYTNEGVAIETTATFIQGIFGIGGETHGRLRVCVESNQDILTEGHIKEDDKGKIIVGGSMITTDALLKAQKLGISAIIAGGINDKELMEFLGYEIGVAITGQEDVGISLIITEGFGKIAMAERTYNLLKKHEGEMVSATGETQIRAGVMRPEIIIPIAKLSEERDELEEDFAGGMGKGTLVRIIREPYFGAIGKIINLPVELQRIESRSMVRVMEVELENGERVIVPRANVEIIEE